MARTTPNVGLHVWDSANDNFVPADLAANWDALDAKFAPSVAPGTEIVYQAIAADTTTTNTTDPGATLFAFSSTAFTAAKHYLHIMIPRISHSVANGQVRFRLRESTTDIAGLVGVHLHATAGDYVNVNILAPFTPTAASHAYTVTWFAVTAGTLTINATGFSPAILRIIKA
jgi:hypothetical protein